MPTFFVPFTTPYEGEAAFEELARMAGLAAPAQEEERVFSIVFIHNGDVWSAKVGERLYGRRSYQSTFAGKPVDQVFEGSDAALVLAIFPGTPYVVVTDGGKAANAPTRWPKVVAAGRPVVVKRFRSSGEAVQMAEPPGLCRLPQPDFSRAPVLGSQGDFRGFVRRRAPSHGPTHHQKE